MSDTESKIAYDNPLDDFLDYVKRNINNLISDFNFNEGNGASELYRVNYTIFDSVVSKYKDVLAQIACIYVYNDDFNNSKMDYDEWINEKIFTFFIDDREGNQDKYEKKMASAVDKIIKGKNAEKYFLKLLPYSIVVSLYLSIKNQKFKTTDQYYPDDEDYYWYSYIFDVSDDGLSNIKSNLMNELDMLNITSSILNPIE